MPQEKYDLVIEGAAEAPPPQQPSGPPNARPRRAYLAAGAAVALIAFAGMWLYLRSYESTDDAQIDGHINPVSARVPGYIIEVDVNDNQYVEKGAVLAKIDPRDYQVAVDRAQAELANAIANARAMGNDVPVTRASSESGVTSAEAAVEDARAGISAAEKQFAAAQAQRAAAEAANAKAQSDLARYSQLVTKQEISQQQYDQAVLNAKAAAADADAARAAAAAAEQQVNQARARLAQAEANLRSAQTSPHQIASTVNRARAADAEVQQKRALLEQAELDLQYCTITAPATGVVNKSAEVGMYVQPGQQLLTVVPIDDVWVTANFKETQLQHIRPGQHVSISVDAFGKTYSGRVDSVAGASGSRFSLLPPENATGNYVKVVQRIPVKIVLDPGENADHRLRPGMSVTPKVHVR